MHYLFFFFFFNDTATTEIYTLSLHDALPICALRSGLQDWNVRRDARCRQSRGYPCPSRFASNVFRVDPRSEEHTSELQSQSNLVCRLLLEKKKKKKNKQ